MKNIPYDKDYPLQRVEEGDAVEILVMHLKWLSLRLNFSKKNWLSSNLKIWNVQSNDIFKKFELKNAQTLKKDIDFHPKQQNSSPIPSSFQKTHKRHQRSQKTFPIDTQRRFSFIKIYHHSYHCSSNNRRYSLSAIFFTLKSINFRKKSLARS